MYSFLENDTEFCRNSIKFLHDVSILPEINVPALKSFYSTKRRLMELRKSILLPSNFTRTSVTCQRCLINLREGPGQYKVLTSKTSVFSKKVVSKQKAGKPLTKYQKKYIERSGKFIGNLLQITCEFCKNKAVIKMEKPNKNIKRKTVKTKKKKQKDKFCGLKQDVVLSSQNIKKEINNRAGVITLKKKKKQVTLNDMNLHVISSLTPQNVRNLDVGKIQNKRPKMKVKNIKVVKVADKSKENLQKSKYKLDKKKQKLSKLGEMLNKPNIAKKSPVSGLKEFLEGL